MSVFEKVDLKEPDYVEFTLSGGATRFRLPIGRPVIEVPEGRKLFFSIGAGLRRLLSVVRVSQKSNCR